MVCPRHTRHTKTPDDRQLLSRLSLNDSANMAKKVHKEVNLFIKKINKIQISLLKKPKQSKIRFSCTKKADSPMDIKLPKRKLKPARTYTKSLFAKMNDF